jgi:hypothetical protein
MPCFSHTFRWSLLKNSSLEETWYRYVINKMCAFSWWKWRDGRTYSCHILRKLKSSLQRTACSFYDTLFHKVPYSSAFFKISFDFDLQLAVLLLHIEDCLRILRGFCKPVCVVLRINRAHALPLSFLLFTDHAGVWTLYASSSSKMFIAYFEQDIKERVTYSKKGGSLTRLVTFCLRSAFWNTPHKRKK